MTDTARKRARAGRQLRAIADFAKRLVREKPLGAVGAAITLVLLLAGIFADWLAPYGMNEAHVGSFLSPPSKTFLLGTDNVGRDILSRVIFGARVSVFVGLIASSVATVLSVIIGVVSGYMGGKVDLLVQRVVDTWMSFPQLVLMMVMMGVIGPGIWQVNVVLGISWGIVGSRILRSAVIAVKENQYVAAARAVGISTTRILVRHILPNIMAPTIILFTTRVPNVILTEASLSFLGFGIPAPTPTWGGMLSGSGRSYMYMAPWMVVWPGLALATVVWGVNMFGDAVRDLLDPKLRGGAGRFDAGAARPAK